MLRLGPGDVPRWQIRFHYSYAVFQHIPSRDVVFGYCATPSASSSPAASCAAVERPAAARAPIRHWNGVRITAAEVAAFVESTGFHLLALEQVWTQYMWITLRNRPWRRRAGQLFRAPAQHFQRAHGEAVTPASGAMAALALWIERLPASCHLLNTTVTAMAAPAPHLRRPASRRRRLPDQRRASGEPAHRPGDGRSRP